MMVLGNAIRLCRQFYYFLSGDRGKLAAPHFGVEWIGLWLAIPSNHFIEVEHVS